MLGTMLTCNATATSPPSTTSPRPATSFDFSSNRLRAGRTKHGKSPRNRLFSPSNDHNEAHDANIELHLATWNLTLSGPGRPDHTSWPRTAAQRLSVFPSFSCVIYFLFTPSLDDTHFAFRFWERYLWVPINSTLRINIDINGIILFSAPSMNSLTAANINDNIHT